MKVFHTMKFLCVIFLGYIFVHNVSGRGINIGICGDQFFDCSCGPDSSGYKINIPMKQCTYFYRWKPYCKPCNDIKKETFCGPFSACLECNNDRCTRCPPNKYGQWCTGVCQCQNGATCNGNDGTCQCVPGYSGASCEIKTTPSCPPPETPLHGSVSGTNYDVGQTVTYSCDVGFALVGHSSRTCTSETRWSGHVPVCERVCPVLNLPENLVSEKNPLNAAGNGAEGALVRIMQFQCSKGFQLIGSEILTCLPSGMWDNQLPSCKKQCSIPKSPENGLVVNTRGIIVEGSTIHFLCNKDYILIGNNEITCINSGNWSHQAPKCEKVTYCPDLGTVDFSIRRVEPGIGGDFSYGTHVIYECSVGAILLGQMELECLKNSTWNALKPSCVFVYDETVTCATNGGNVIEGLNIPIRITCPGGCNVEKTPVWGSVIYRKESKVCAAAIHAGMIPATGGSVFVVNNGIYNMFFPSNSNGIKSSRYRNPTESFRFDFIEEDEESRCPPGWTEHGIYCLAYINKAASLKTAESICKNLDSEMVTGNGLDEVETNRIVARIALNKGQFKIWFGNRLNNLLKSSNGRNASEVFNATNHAKRSNLTLPLVVNGTAEALMDNTTDPDGWMVKEAKMLANSSCAALDFQSGVTASDCAETLNFMCRMNASFMGKDDVVCDDPGTIAFGTPQYEETVHGLFLIGSTITYHCNPLYQLKGETTITCTNNGTWSGKKPICTKVPACREPAAIKNGLYNFLPSLDARTVGEQSPHARSAPISSSSARGLSITFSSNKTSETQADVKKVPIPTGFYHVGTRVQFSCESRYYNLIGSSTRTCLPEGHWSGRQPTCLPVCGISSAPRAPFIVNGQPTKLGQWPWQAGLARRVVNAGATAGVDNSEWFLSCGAALLTESWVVTAAHCVTKETTMTVLAPTEFQLYFGKYYRNDSMDDSWVQVRQVKDVHVYPDFNPVLYDGDIALIQLNEPVQLTSRVQPVCLPDIISGMSDRHLQTGTIGVVTGWGMDEKKQYSSTLLQADVPVVSSSECEQGYLDADISLSVSGNMFCAGYKEGVKQDACSGDSGGPFVMSEGTGVHERWYLEGIVSWGSPFGCGEDRQYGGYTKVSMFIDWIQQFI